MVASILLRFVLVVATNVYYYNIVHTYVIIYVCGRNSALFHNLKQDS